MGEGGVTLQHEFVERTGGAKIEIRVCDFAFISQSAFWCGDRAFDRLVMFVLQTPETIRQTKAARSEQNADAIRKPFSEKKNSRLAVMTDIGADV